MTSLKANLSLLKSKLMDIETQIEEETTQAVIKQVKNSSLEEKEKEVLNNQTNLITLNIGGIMFTTSKKTLLKDPKSVFSILLTEDETLDYIFFDRSPSVFGVLLDYLRFGRINYKRFNKEELLELYTEAQYYEITDIRDYLEERTKDINLVSFEFSGAYSHEGKTAGTNNVLDLKDKSCKKGICTKSPGWISFELNCIWEFDTLEIGGYQGNNKIWYSGNGCGAKIMVSDDKKKWKNVGNINPKFAKEVVEVKLNEKVNTKYIKFSSSSYLGIGYLNIIKDDE